MGNAYQYDVATSGLFASWAASEYKKPETQTDKRLKFATSESLSEFFNSSDCSKATYQKTFAGQIDDKQYNDLKAKYHDCTKAKDLKLENIEQGKIDSCYMLSAISSRSGDIEKSKCLRWNKDGSCDVSFYDVKKTDLKMSIPEGLWSYARGSYEKRLYEPSKEKTTFHISADELKKTKFDVTENGKPKTVELSQNQDLTAKAIEIGMIKYHKNDVAFSNFGGTLEKEQKMLYGKNAPEVREAWAGRVSKSHIQKGANCFLPVVGSLTGSAAAKAYINSRDEKGDIVVNDVNGKPVKIFDQHAYTINGYDKKTDTVSFSNPHHNDLRSTKDDIVLPYKTFKDLFNVEYINN